jgi:heme exporter protein A
MLAATQLGKRFGPRWLFRGVEIDLQKGDCLAVTGRNGSGKSTLLKCLVGLAPLSEGSVRIEGDFGYSSLDLSVYPALSAVEHLELSADLRGCDARSQELLEYVGLTAAANQMASEFSTGMRARLKLAVALQSNPAVLVLDEPGASLDEAGRNLLSAVIEDQKSRGACLLATNESFELSFATHRLEIES